MKEASDHEKKLARAYTALSNLRRHSEPVSVTAVAEEAGVARSTIYGKHPEWQELLEVITKNKPSPRIEVAEVESNILREKKILSRITVEDILSDINFRRLQAEQRLINTSFSPRKPRNREHKEPKWQKILATLVAGLIPCSLKTGSYRLKKGCQGMWLAF